jgi:hypothetical protein
LLALFFSTTPCKPPKTTSQASFPVPLVHADPGYYGISFGYFCNVISFGLVYVVYVAGPRGSAADGIVSKDFGRAAVV